MINLAIHRQGQHVAPAQRIAGDLADRLAHRATAGVTSGALGAFTGWTWDDTNTLTVTLDAAGGARATIRDVEVSRDWVAYLQMATAGRDRLIEREDTKGFFHNGWRPAMSWLVIFLFAWSMVAVPLANATLGGAIAAPSTNDILQFAGIWLVIYGGGHTVKSVWGAK